MGFKRNCNFLTKCQLVLGVGSEPAILQGRITILIKPHK